MNVVNSFYLHSDGQYASDEIQQGPLNHEEGLVTIYTFMFEYVPMKRLRTLLLCEFIMYLSMSS